MIGQDGRGPGGVTGTWYDLAICTDCLLFLANGDLPEDRPDLAADIEREWPTAYLATGLYRPDGHDENEDESWFSSSDCDCCGSRLGGDRHNASAFVADKS